MHPKYRCHTKKKCFVLNCVQFICSIVNLERDYRRKISTTDLAFYYYIVSFFSLARLLNIGIMPYHNLELI